MREKLVVLTGPQGVGKDAVCDELGIKKVISFATREQRAGEVNEKDYYFVSKEKFKELIGQGKIVEWISYRGEYKGTPKQELEAVLLGEERLWKVDIATAANFENFIKGIFPADISERIIKNTTVIFLGVENLMELYFRLRGRGESREDAFLMVKSGWEEWNTFSGKFENVVINTNGNLEVTVKRVKEIIK